MKSFTYNGPNSTISCTVKNDTVSIEGCASDDKINERIARNVRSYPLTDTSYAACKSVVLGLVKSIRTDYVEDMVIQPGDHMIAFIPHSQLSEGMCFKTNALLEQLKKETGAEHAEYHRGAAAGCDCCSRYNFGEMSDCVYHVVLTNPGMAMNEVSDKYANSFAQGIPVWYWYK